MRLVIRSFRDQKQPIAYPQELEVTSDQTPDGLPWLCGELENPAPRELTLLLRIHNKAGIPIIEGQSRVEGGQKQLVFSELRMFGIEAYSHLSETERRYPGNVSGQDTPMAH